VRSPKQQLVDLIFSYADVTGSRVAVEQGNRSVSYTELRERVRDRASMLANRGAPHTFVALEQQKSPEFIVDYLAVLSVDGVVIPLDPDTPPERRDTFLDLVRPELLLRHRGVSRLAPRAEPYRLATDEGGWVYFTPGSAGVPKPVLGSVVGVRSFVDWFIPEFDVRPSDRFGFLTEVSFEASLRDIFAPLAAGATVVLPTEADTATPQATVAWLAGKGISVVTVAPSVARRWLRHGRVTCPTVRAAFFIGEALAADVVTGWQGTFPATAVRVNSYGSTESGQGTIYCDVAVDQAITEWVPAGRPVPGTRFCLIPPEATLDAELVRQSLSRPAVRGEIVIVSRACSLGYLGLPEENRTRFAHLGGGVTGYRTGDLGTVDGNGQLIVIGRVDDGMKVNRVHPVEVTGALGKQPPVADAFLTATRTVLTGLAEPAAAPDDLRPFGEIEAWLADQLADLLDVARPPAAVHVFAPGCDSIVAAILLSRIEQQYGVRLSVPEILAATSVRDIAAEIEEHMLLTADPAEIEALLDVMAADGARADALEHGV
jgi:non-ribosomal peptide synthetase component F/acyl carrier protein